MKRKINNVMFATVITMCVSLTLGQSVYAEEPIDVVTVESQTLGLPSVDNARQLGGYRTMDGRYVKENMLYRTAKLATANEEDLDKLYTLLNVGYIVDFRTSQEIASAPDPELIDVKYSQIKVLDENSNLPTTQAVTNVYNATTDNPAESLLQMYRNGTLDEDMYTDVVTTEIAQNGYRLFFDVLLNNSEEKAVLWHCTGGKDRTGTATVLLLSALGVDRETILNDFALTNNFNQKKIAYMGKKAMELTQNADEIDGVMYLTGVNRNFMEKTLSYIEDSYGSIEKYLINVLGLTKADILKLQDMYLTK